MTKQRRQAQQLLEASSIGWMFPIAMGLGVRMRLGDWTSSSDTRPWLTWIFTGFGSHRGVHQPLPHRAAKE